MDQLPISIQKIIWEDYVDPDYEDLITEKTKVEDLLIVFNILCASEDDKLRIMMVSCKINNIDVFDYTLSRKPLLYGELATMISISMSYGYLYACRNILGKYRYIWNYNRGLFVRNIRTGLLLGFKNACRDVHFEITDWIIDDWINDLGKQTVIECILDAMKAAKRSNSKKIKIKYQYLLDENTRI